MIFLLNFLISLTFLTVVTTSLWLWAQVISRWRAGEPILESPTPIPWVRWGLVDLILMLGLLVGLQVTATFFIGLLPLPEQVVRMDELNAMPPTGDGEFGLLADPDRDGAEDLSEIQSPQGRTGAEMLDATPARRERLLWTMVVANFAWVLLCLWGMKSLRGLTMRDLGFDRERLLDDVRLGFAAFCLLAPVVYGLQFALVQLWPSEHPIVDMIRKDETGRLLWLGAVTAILAAPLFEELAFRLFLQGWLENVVRVIQGRPLPREMAMEDVNVDPGDRYWQVVVQGWRPMDSANPERAEPNTFHELFPRVSKQSSDNHVSGKHVTDNHNTPAARRYSTATGEARPEAVLEADVEGDMDALPSRVGLERSAAARDSEPRFLALPIFFSSLIFALLHYNHGPDWIPLLFLAFGLGYIFQRTRRILPCILVHLLLNATSFGMLILQLALGN